MDTLTSPHPTTYTSADQQVTAIADVLASLDPVDITGALLQIHAITIAEVTNPDPWDMQLGCPNCDNGLIRDASTGAVDLCDTCYGAGYSIAEVA